jgi:metal transporter CNNM
MLMWLCAPIAWPLGKLLDALLGHSSSVMQRHELKAMVELHGTGAGLGGRLSPQEIKIIHGVLDLTGKTALEVMLPLDTARHHCTCCRCVVVLHK